MTLMGNGVARSVGAPERCGASNRFQVDAPSAAGAVIDDQPGIALEQRIPESIQAFDVADLGHALAVGGIGGGPKWQRVDIEVLPITAEPELFDFIANEIGEELASLRVAEVEQEIVTTAEQPVAMFFVPGCVFENAFRFEPEHQ